MSNGLTAEQLKKLELHKKWIKDEDDGACANFYAADLEGTNLSYTNLTYAYLSKANLKNADLSSANLSNTDLSGTNLTNAGLINTNLENASLSSANLKNADLRGANLKNADLDYSCLPLWCGSLGVHFDDKQLIQILYHLLYNVQYSKNASQELKDKLLTRDLIELANRFHRTECKRLGGKKQ